jgi:hypothetical protein
MKDSSGATRIIDSVAGELKASPSYSGSENAPSTMRDTKTFPFLV